MTDLKYQYLRVALVGLLMAGTVCAFETGAHAQSQCQTGTINVNDCFVELKKTATGIDVNPTDVGVYSGTKLSWQYKPVSTANPNFDVDFDVDCTPFVDRHFDQATPETTHGADPLSDYQFERCKYRVTIDGLKVDPHVIVVGGSRGHHHDKDKHK